MSTTGVGCAIRIDPAEPAQWFGQPRGLTVLFLTEMWEKFSYYGMRAILVYYMTRELLIPQHQASYIYGLYTAFVYLTPIAGGMISDRWLGRRYSVVIGGSIICRRRVTDLSDPPTTANKGLDRRCRY